MPETMAGLKGFCSPFSTIYGLFLPLVKVSIVSAIIFVDSIVSVHRIYERGRLQRYSFFISANYQEWCREK
jgi:hypothetical protein